MRQDKTVQELQEEVKKFLINDDWKGVVAYLNEGEHKPLLLWPRPSTTSIDFIVHHLKNNQVSNLLSLGCGTGLFEWIIKSAINDLTVLGVEVDENWWTSAYAPPVFLPLNYPDDNVVIDALSKKSTALFFCYFNCEPAWREYLADFKGSLVFVCGPVEGSGTHSDPQPFQPLSPEWTVVDGLKIQNTHDAIAVYARI